jgi:hypothetical protein
MGADTGLNNTKMRVTTAPSGRCREGLSAIPTSVGALHERLRILEARLATETLPGWLRLQLQRAESRLRACEARWVRYRWLRHRRPDLWRLAFDWYRVRT